MATTYHFSDSAHSKAQMDADFHNTTVWVVFRPLRDDEDGYSADEPVYSWAYELVEADVAPPIPNDGTRITGHYTPDMEYHPWIMARDDVARALGATPDEVRDAMLSGTLTPERVGQIEYVRGADVERVKQHGGLRAGAGRKPVGDEAMVRRTVTLPGETVVALEQLGEGNLSAGVRIAAQRACQDSLPF